MNPGTADFPVRWPREYRARALELGAGSPLLRMGTRHPCEDRFDPDGLDDPTGEARFQPEPFLVRKHRDRAVVLAASRCFFYCRFCFRRGAPPGSKRTPGRGDWARITEWLRNTPEVREVILSGGDPLTLSDRRLSIIARSLESVPSLQSWRIHTRAPVTFPERVTGSLIDALSSALPLRVAIHANHPAELRPTLLGAVRRFRDAGTPVLNQTVLLAGVNDDAGILAELFRGLSDAGVTPYYLHHPDRAPGNAAFRLSIERGLRIHREFCGHGGEKPPPYVLDLPNGAGKCPVESLVPVAQEQGPRGRRVRYRWVRPRGWDCLVPDESFEWWDVGRQANHVSRNDATSAT